MTIFGQFFKKMKMIFSLLVLIFPMMAFAGEPKTPAAVRLFTEMMMQNRYRLPGINDAIVPARSGYLTGLGDNNETVINVPLTMNSSRFAEKVLMLSFIDGDDTSFYVTPVVHPFRTYSNSPPYTPSDDAQKLLSRLDQDFDQTNLVVIKADGTVEGKTNSNNAGKVVLGILSNLRIAKGVGMKEHAPISIRIRVPNGKVESVKEAITKAAIAYFGPELPSSCMGDLTPPAKPDDLFKPTH